MPELAAMTVTALNERVKSLIEGDALLSGVAVRGELSNYKIYPSGHHYFSLKDAESSLRCVMFRAQASRLPFAPKNGMEVTAIGRVSVFSRDGVYQLYCAALLPGGTGDLHAAFEQLKKKLEAEGLFAESHKKRLPAFPGRVAVITSDAGAAVRDIIRVLGRRWPLAEVIVLPVRVQGTEAPGEIAEAIAFANRYRVADLIITGRGGGSIEDLWAFNDERVARAIYASEIPVISAVGHEPDVTIADFVADLRAATPSNAAELAVPDAMELKETLLSMEVRAFQAVHKRLEAYRERLGELASRRVMQSPTAYFDERRQAVDYMRALLTASMERLLSARRRDYAVHAAALDALSPLKVLSRGYAIAESADGTVVKSIGQVRAGDVLRLRVTDGEIPCQVTESRLT